jgi:deoxyribonuclease V
MSHVREVRQARVERWARRFVRLATAKDFNIAERIREARQFQLELAGQVRCVPLKIPVELVVGVDAAFSGNRVFAAACLYALPSLKPVEDAAASGELGFPYVPGFLTFREGPAILEAVAALSRKPDLILVDGQGIAHPRRLGIASHIGVLLGVPTVGCAKSRLVGEFREPGRARGRRSRLRFDGQTVGAVVRTRTGVRPLFVSPGHLVDIPNSVRIVLRTTGGFRIPEPLRRADALSRAHAKA